MNCYGYLETSKQYDTHMENSDCLNTVHLFYRTIGGKTLGVLVVNDGL